MDVMRTDQGAVVVGFVRARRNEEWVNFATLADNPEKVWRVEELPPALGVEFKFNNSLQLAFLKRFRILRNVTLSVGVLEQVLYLEFKNVP